jgi:hypothetical protein
MVLLCFTIEEEVWWRIAPLVKVVVGVTVSRRVNQERNECGERRYLCAENREALSVRYRFLRGTAFTACWPFSRQLCRKTGLGLNGTQVFTPGRNCIHQ